MTHASRMAEIKDKPNAASWKSDIAYLLARVEALEAALGEAIPCVDPVQCDIARLTAALEGEDNG